MRTNLNENALIHSLLTPMKFLFICPPKNFHRVTFSLCLYGAANNGMKIHNIYFTMKFFCLIFDLGWKKVPLSFSSWLNKLWQFPSLLHFWIKWEKISSSHRQSETFSLFSIFLWVDELWGLCLLFNFCLIVHEQLSC
jgi:hypothetical protein